MKPTKEQLDLVSDITDRNVFTQCINGVWHYGQIHIDPDWFTDHRLLQANLDLLDNVIEQCIERDHTNDVVSYKGKPIYLSLIPVESYHRYLLAIGLDHSALSLQ